MKPPGFPVWLWQVAEMQVGNCKVTQKLLAFQARIPLWMFHTEQSSSKFAFLEGLWSVFVSICFYDLRVHDVVQ